MSLYDAAKKSELKASRRVSETERKPLEQGCGRLIALLQDRKPKARQTQDLQTLRKVYVRTVCWFRMGSIYVS